MKSIDNSCLPLPVPFDCGVEWVYEMRRKMQEILPGLFLGPMASAGKTHFQKLKDNGITHIVCVRSPLEASFLKPYFEGHFKYLVIEVVFSRGEKIMEHIPIVNKFIDEALGHGGKVLVHGVNGGGRSAALVVGYIMTKYGLTLSNACEFVANRRRCIGPDQGLLIQLETFVFGTPAGNMPMSRWLHVRNRGNTISS